VGKKKLPLAPIGSLSRCLALLLWNLQKGEKNIVDLTHKNLKEAFPGMLKRHRNKISAW